MRELPRIFVFYTLLDLIGRLILVLSFDNLVSNFDHLLSVAVN